VGAAGSALAGSMLTALLLAGTPGVAAAAPAGPAKTLPPPPVCATAIAISDGRTTSTPSPLPPPASASGGARLAQPGLQVSLAAGAARPPALRATAWIVADLGTGNVLASCNAHVPLAPASTLKILTALALHGRIDPRKPYVATAGDAGMDGTRVGLVPGSRYTVDNLWHGLLMGSGNDAANALASLVGGTAAAGQLMTTTAHSLGAGDTVVRNTSGLDAPGQATSVYDLAIFGRALLREPALAQLVRTKTYRFPGKGSGSGRARKGYQIQNHDLLLFRYPGATGIKNGYTTAASASFVGSATRNGHSYVVALLRTDVDSWRLAASLLDWAFAAGGHVVPVGALDPTPVPAGGPAPVAPPAAATPRPAASTPTSPSRAAAVPASRTGTKPLSATLEALPTQDRAVWIAAAFAVAFVGAAAVGRFARGRTQPAPARRGGGRRPATRSTATRPTARRSSGRAAIGKGTAKRSTSPRRSSR
jgi:D-alanyl-D-alanine carboxypeptidase (penicillin-binding protein 5/6)